MRNKKGLNGKQTRFIMKLVMMEGTTDEIMRELNMRNGTLKKWIGLSGFLKEWEAANKVLTMLGESEEGSLRIETSRYRRKRIRKRILGEASCAGDVGTIEEAGGEMEAEVVEAMANSPMMTERERVKARHGEEAALAYDRLVRIRRGNLGLGEEGEKGGGDGAGEAVAGAGE